MNPTDKHRAAADALRQCAANWRIRRERALLDEMYLAAVRAMLEVDWTRRDLAAIRATRRRSPHW